MGIAKEVRNQPTKVDVRTRGDDTNQNNRYLYIGNIRKSWKKRNKVMSQKSGGTDVQNLEKKRKRGGWEMKINDLHN